MLTFPCYVYLHKNGSLIPKSTFVCETGTTPEEYFDSPFVIDWWKVENGDNMKPILKRQEDYKKDNGIIKND